jgi:geranylgeranyl pyrophosphate synthase
MSFDHELAEYQQQCEKALEQAAADTFVPDSQVSAAAEYALLGGGKRVRGVLVQAAGTLLGGNKPAQRMFAAAIEMIHAFSLVHDDLPCMDNDAMRRGRPSTHVKFGESTALLAGNLLNVEAFAIMAESGLDNKMLVRAVKILASATGSMIYGQELDLHYETQPADEKALRLIHTHKTGALLCAAAELGMVTAGRTPEDEPELARYAANLGLAFQIVDDILDVTADEATLGKPIGSDAERGKTTFVTMFGLEAARRHVRGLTSEAVTALRTRYSDKANFLAEYANQLAVRIR